MIKLKSLLMVENHPDNNGEEFSDIDQHIWYHGRTTLDTTFSLNYVGKGEDQEGPGFYFTNYYEDAVRYSNKNGTVFKCKIDYKKLILKTHSSRTKVNKKVIIDLINKSPTKNDTLENFDENPQQAFVKAINGYMFYKNADDAYQILANDFYKYSPGEYLKVLSKYYDAQLTDLRLTAGVKHLIVYNPDLIKIIETIPYDKTRLWKLKPL